MGALGYYVRRLAAAGAAVRAPGDRSEACRARRLEQGIPLPRVHWEHLVQRLAACGVTADLE